MSQFFAGRDHGALWHPRVGDEVVVDFIDGDPDRPIVVGRVYNGTHPAPENATQRPTYSAIKSNTSPYDGNYNLIAFEDLQGSEELVIHAARDLNSNVLRSQSSFVGLHDTINVKGDQKITVDCFRTVKVGASQHMTISNVHSVKAGGLIFNQAPTISLTNDLFINNSSAVAVISSGAHTDIQSGGKATVSAPNILISGAVTKVGAGLFEVNAGTIQLTGGIIKLVAAGPVDVSAAAVKVNGAGAVDINGGTVNVKGGSINLNC